MPPGNGSGRAGRRPCLSAGACLLPFAFTPAGVTLVCFAVGGLIYGPFIPLTYTLLQSSAPGANLPVVLAARSAIVMVASPFGTAAGGPVVGALGAAWTLTASGAATVALAIISGMLWARRERRCRTGHLPLFRSEPESA